MIFAGIKSSPHLQVFHYDDVDHFRAGFRNASVDFIPLANSKAPLGQAVLTLPNCNVYLLRTFPRIVTAAFDGSRTFAMFSMSDAPQVVFNGKEVSQRSMKFASGPIEYRAVEKQPGYYGTIVFSSLIEGRGWPEAQGEFLTVPISHELELGFRSLILRLFKAVSTDHQLITVPAAAERLEITLLEMLDQAFEDHRQERIEPLNAKIDLRLTKLIDDFIDLKRDRPIYTEEIATTLGISVRSLTNLMRKSNGMSLQRYLRLRRLWSVRRQLMTGDPQIKIKEIAFAQGFWHMGDFAAKYFREFGELPSTTHLRITEN